MMAKQVCLPRCFNPVFPDPCDLLTGHRICCIKFTMPCGEEGSEVELSFDGYTLLLGSEYYAPNTDGTYGHGLTGFEVCQNSVTGATPVAGFPNDPDITGESIPLWFFGVNIPRGSGFAVQDITDVVGYEEHPCTGWPEYLTDISDLTETEIVDVDTTIYRKAIPCLRWACVTGGEIYFEAGWCVYWQVNGPGGLSDIFFDGFFKISAGRQPADWYTTETPFLLEEKYPNITAGFQSTVTPVFCYYEPCGDPLDCFAACISGTVECDGVTPAHVPTVYLTLTHLVSESLGCCFVGTYPLEFGAGSGAGVGYYLDPDETCTTPINGFVYTMKASLTCASVSDPDSPYTAGSNTAVLSVRFYGPGGAYALYSAIVSLSCTGGVLNDSSGVWTGTGCGLFGTIGWAISV